MRLFIALNLPDETRARIQTLAEPLREAELPVRWVQPDSFHVTMKFLGDAPRERLPAIRRLLDEVAAKNRAVDVVMEGWGAFPTIRRPRILWLGAEASPELRSLKQDLEWALSDLDFEREARAFHPHVTVGRVEGRAGAGAFRGLDQLLNSLDHDLRVEVTTLDLMRSHLSRSRPRYSVVHGSPLGGSHPGRSG